MKKIPEPDAAEDDGAWSELIKTVRPLPPQEIKPTAPLIIDAPKPTINYAKVYQGDTLAPLSVGSVENIDRRTAERFLRGEWPIQARLDLHGLTEKEAYPAVEEFITAAYRRGLRCVLLVTGKGCRRENDDLFARRGVLREQVPQWLNTAPLRPLVLAFSYAKPADGGEGALYILLRRARS